MELSPHSLTARIMLPAVFGVWLDWTGLLPYSPFSALPPQGTYRTLALKLFRGEPAITKFDWNFSPNHTSSHCVAQQTGSGLPTAFLRGSPWAWLAHLVSGLVNPADCSPFRTRFPCAFSRLTGIKQARYTNSLAHSSIGTPSLCLAAKLRLLVSKWFQILFHSPSGVLFTFPSWYLFAIDHQTYLALPV